MMVKSVGTRAGKLFSTGLRPQAGFGIDVWGCSGTELSRLQKLAAACASPSSAGTSRAAKLLLQGDPTASMATAAANRLAKEVWMSYEAMAGSDH